MILHCMKKSIWENRKKKEFWGKTNIKTDGFIHCSTVEYFWRVAPNFKKEPDDLVLLCIDETKLSAELRYEDADNCARLYPHVYGLINNDAVLNVLPFLKDKNGNWIKNPELAHIENK